MSRASRLLLRHGLRWLAVATAATALLVLLVDWVELGNRMASARGGIVLASLHQALLLLPGHMSQASPVVVALGAAITVVGLRRSGEWQALGAAGLGPTHLLRPFLVLGLLAGLAAAALDAWVVPPAVRAHDRTMHRYDDRPLHLEGRTWVSIQGVMFELSGDPGAGLLGPCRAFRAVHSAGDPQVDAWVAERLRWDGAAWRPEGATLGQGIPLVGGAPPPETSGAAPWDALPPPERLAERVGSLPPAARSWATLRDDRAPDARTERAARLSRALVAPLAALVAAALASLLAPSSVAVLLGTLPVLGWELLAVVIQSQASAGATAPVSVLALRLGVAILALAALGARLRRP